MSRAHESRNLRYYNENAKALSQLYNAYALETWLPVYAEAAIRYQSPEKHALDMGCGSGSDPFWLAERGWTVDAVDGSRDMLGCARETYPHPEISYIHDIAPDLPALSEKAGKYNSILMSAFIFHFEEAERKTILQKCFNKLAASGMMHITLRHGPSAEGRTMFPVETAEIEDFAKRHRMHFKDHGRKDDEVGRADVTWRHVSLWRGKVWDHLGGYNL
jgi:2-polyprenyl-3-methyl-5-hydroxy-6-metoxy-1,4-benzoquinol methylase